MVLLPRDRGVSKVSILAGLGLVALGVALTLLEEPVGLVLLIVGLGLFVSLSVHRSDPRRIR